jgi:hypothetical protein
MIKIVPLSEDLTNLLGSWSENPYRSDYQKQRWPQKKITHDQLGWEHPNTLFLSEIDGGDGRPVGSYKASSAKRFWSWDIDHVFPTKPNPNDPVNPNRPRPDLVRLSVFLHMDLSHTLALMLKGLWEDFFAHKMGWPGQGELIKILYNQEEAEAMKHNFNPDTKDLFHIFEENGKLVSAAGYTQQNFDTLVQEMIAANLHLVANNSSELQAFAERTMKERELLKSSTREQEEAFWIAKCIWLELHEKLGETLLTLEKQRLENANTTHRWLSIFGDAYFELREQEFRCGDLRRRIDIMETDIEMPREGLDKKVAEIEAEKQKELEKLRFEISLARYIHRLSPTGMVDPEEFNEYQRECKRVLREIYRLIYPDKLRYNQSYDKLTVNQKKYLGELWYRVMEIKPVELGYAPGQVGYDNRALPAILDILAEAKVILENAGIDTDVRMIIQGETIGEQLNWLENEIENLEQDIKNVKVELEVLLEDKEIEEMRSLLECSPEQQDTYKSKLLELAEQKRAEADELEAYLESLFKRGE